LKSVIQIFFKKFIAGSASQTQSLSSATETNLPFFSSSNTSTSLGGKASLQPKRTHVTNDEIEAVLVCGISSLMPLVFVSFRFFTSFYI
jgi:hypothetical protein